MELFENLRLRIGNALLHNKVSKTTRKKSYKSLNLVKNIGIVWDASRTDEFAFLSRFHQRMAENKAEVNILGYYSGTSLPNQYTAIRFLSVIKKEELNFFYQPVSLETNTFVNKKFDVLIDLNFKKLLPLKYISSLSNASLKVGLFESEAGNTPFDLMMDIKSPVNVEEYLNHVLHYLEMINSGSAN